MARHLCGSYKVISQGSPRNVNVFKYGITSSRRGRRFTKILVISELFAGFLSVGHGLSKRGDSKSCEMRYHKWKMLTFLGIPFIIKVKLKPSVTIAERKANILGCWKDQRHLKEIDNERMWSPLKELKNSLHRY